MYLKLFSVPFESVVLAIVSVQTSFPSHLFQQPAHPYLLLHQLFLQPRQRPLQVQLTLRKQQGCWLRRGALPVSSGNGRSKKGGRERSLKGDSRPLQCRRYVFSSLLAASCVYSVVILWYMKHSTEMQEAQVPPQNQIFLLGVFVGAIYT